MAIVTLPDGTRVDTSFIRGETGSGGTTVNVQPVPSGVDVEVTTRTRSGGSVSRTYRNPQKDIIIQPSGVPVEVTEIKLSPRQKLLKAFFEKQGKKITFTNGRVAVTDPRTGRKTLVRGDLITEIPRSAAIHEGFEVRIERQRERARIKIKKEAQESAKKLQEIKAKKFIDKFKELATIRALKKPKTTAQILSYFAFKKGQLLQKTLTSKSVVKKGVVIPVALAGIGAARGVIGFKELVVHPIKAVKGLLQMAKTPRATAYHIGQQFAKDPVGTVAEFYTFGKTIGVTAKVAKRSPVGRYLAEEAFIRAQPKKLQKAVRTVIKSAKVQEKLNPHKIKTIKRVGFGDIKSLNKIESQALLRTTRETNSLIFGSKGARILSKGKTPVAKDLDLGTANIPLFKKKFIANLPRGYAKKHFIIKGEKITRKGTGKTIFDVKPLDRVTPGKSLLTGRGELPVTGYGRRLRVYPEKLPEIKYSLIEGRLRIPTQKRVKVEGIKIIGFGEQTTRKGLGTLQVLLEKSITRQKDPHSFLIGLEVQKYSLMKLRPKTRVGKILIDHKIRKLNEGIKYLKSTEFSQILEARVPGITKEFPLVARLKGKVKPSVKEISKAKDQIEKAKLGQVKEISDIKRVVRDIEKGKVPSIKLPTKVSRLPPSKIPEIPASRIPKLIPSKFPKRIPSSMIPKPPPSRVPKLPSKIPKIHISKIPKIPHPSKIPKTPPPSRVPKLPSKIPRIIHSRIPEIPLSKIPGILPSRIPKITLSKIPGVPPPKKTTPFKRKEILKKVRIMKKLKPTQQFVKFTHTIQRAGKTISKKRRLQFWTGVELR